MTGRGAIIVALVVAVVAGACGLHWVRASNGDSSGGGGAAMDLAETFKCNVCQVSVKRQLRALGGLHRCSVPSQTSSYHAWPAGA